jgi:hypothetical protein
VVGVVVGVEDCCYWEGGYFFDCFEDVLALVFDGVEEEDSFSTDVESSYVKASTEEVCAVGHSLDKIWLLGILEKDVDDFLVVSKEFCRRWIDIFGIHGGKISYPVFAEILAYLGESF